MRLAAALLAAAAVLAGCGPRERIAGTANDIRDEARMLVVRGTETQDAEVVERAERIDALAATIHEDLTGTQDITPAWMKTLMWVGAAVVAVALVVLVWQTGLGTALRTAVGWIPRRKMSQAELAVDMLDPSRPEGDREFIAAMRQDPEFDLAYRKAQQRRKAPKT